MILLWGLPGDGPLDAVHQELARLGAPFVLLDQRRLAEQRIVLELGEALAGTVWMGEVRVDLGQVDAVYTRVYDSRALPAHAHLDDASFLRLREVEVKLWAWLELAEARVVNRPSAMASNGSKPYQAALIEAEGFRIPRTLITNDPEEARAFWREHGAVIYKSVSGVRSVVSRLGPEHESRLADITWCPTQFQAYVPGRDYRVQVVGDRCFGCEIVSDAVDYRYAGRQGLDVALRDHPLPEEVAERCRATARALRLPVAGLDLRRTPEGAWYCFEVNPSPCFTYYERHTGQPITAAVAAFLMGGERRGARAGHQ